MLWVVAPGRYPSSFQLGAGYCLPQQSTWVDTCNLVGFRGNPIRLIGSGLLTRLSRLQPPGYPGPLRDRLHRCLVFTVALFA